MSHDEMTTTRIFLGGRILTMDRQHANAEAVAIANGRIVAVGARDLVARYPDAVVEHLNGRTLLPGFIDAHNHLSIAALHPIWADVSAARSVEELGQILLAQAGREPGARWVRACDWNETLTGLMPTRADLDALGMNRPIIVAHYSLHQGVVSSLGLDELHIGRTTPDPIGGTIERGPDGEPTGLLVERAWSEAHARSMAAYRDADRWSELIAARARVLLRDGITCVHDAACSPPAEAVYRKLQKAGGLPIAVLMLPHAEAILTNARPPQLDGPVTGEGDEQLRVGPMKFFADGGIAPAIDACIAGQRGTYGIRFDDLAENLVAAVARGFRVAVHAMGNAGLAAALDAFRRAARVRDVDHRFRVEHATLASRTQMRDMSALGVVGVVQPGFLDHMGRLVENVQFDEETWLPFGDLARSGVSLAASSDDPCAIYRPVRTAAHGVTRRTGSGGILGAEQAVPYEDWLRAYTAGAAYAGGQEAERGTLAPGKRADLVILQGDLDAEHPPRVVQTWVGGELAYAAD